MQEAYRPQCIKYYLVGYPLVRVPPHPGLMGRGVPIGTHWGTPLSQVQWGVPEVGYPPPGPGSSTPPPHLDLAQVPSPLLVWTDRWMDRRVSKHNLPSYYVRDR